MQTFKHLKRVTGLGLVTVILGLAGCASHPNRTTGQYWDDVHTAHAIKSNLNHEPVYKFPNLNVAVYSGKAQLSGFVNTEEQRARAAELAANTRGVTEVINAIVVQPLTPTGRATIRDAYDRETGQNLPPPSSTPENPNP